MEWRMNEINQLTSSEAGARNNSWNELNYVLACRPKAKQTNQFHQSSLFLALKEKWNDWLELIDLMNGNNSLHQLRSSNKDKKLSLIGGLCWLKRYYNSTCFIDHIFLKGYHSSINQHLITVIIINGINQSLNYSTMNGIQSTFWLNGVVCWFVWWWLMEWLCCPFTHCLQQWLRVVGYRFSSQLNSNQPSIKLINLLLLC